MTPALLRVRDDVLVMQTLMWPDEIRTPDFGSLKDVAGPEAAGAGDGPAAARHLAGDYDPDDFEDDYAEAVQTLVQAKLEGGEVKRTKEAAPSAGEVVDLLAALQRSVAAAKKGRGEDDDESGEADDSDEQTGTSDGSTKKATKKDSSKKKPTKKAASKKTAAKKTAAKKTPAKKSA